MKRKDRSWKSKTVGVLSVLVVGGVLMFGSFGNESGPLGKRQIMAQGAQTLEGVSGVLALGPGGDGSAASSDVAPVMSPEKAAARAALEQRRAAAWAARAAGLPAVDPRVPQTSSAPQLSAAVVKDATVGPQPSGGIAVFRATEIVPPAGFGSVVNEPAVSQNGMFVHETWNWYAARSSNGGIGWGLLNPETYTPGMPDFCCDQDTIYDKGRDRFFWERMGIDNVGSNQNRILINVSQNAFLTSLCFADLRGTDFGEANAFLDYPRMSLSNNFLYLSVNIFDWFSGNFRKHLIVRADLDLLSTCTSFTHSYWKFVEGWNPTAVENAREIMYSATRSSPPRI